MATTTFSPQNVIVGGKTLVAPLKRSALATMSVVDSTAPQSATTMKIPQSEIETYFPLSPEARSRQNLRKAVPWVIAGVAGVSLYFLLKKKGWI